MDSSSDLSLLFPPRFALGDSLGLVAPASPPGQAGLIDETIARLTAYGFRIKPGKNLRQRNSYLAGSDEERADDLNALFADPEVRGIFALRGGYGSCRILSLLDYAAIRANPKPFIGYSDITAMHNAILVKSRLITFHGSNGSSAFQPGNEAAMKDMLLGSRRPLGDGPLLFSRDGADRSHGSEVKTLVPGQVTGCLIGGNMTCLLRLIGTPYEPDFRGAILFLEDTGEKAYRVDGMFTHLRLAGILPQLGGLVIGQFDHPDPEEEKRIQACLQREAERIGVPCVTGAPIGHFPEQIVVPHGAQARLDATSGQIELIGV